MKNLIARTGLLIAAGLVALLPVAANAGTIAQFHVPFQFLAGEKVLPAGNYVVTVDPASGRVDLTSTGGQRLALLGTSSFRARTSGEPAVLVFHQYGKTHVLKNVWKSDSSWGYELPAPRLEREVASARRAGSTVEIASAAIR
jgi:hypothetical protein